MIRIVHNAAVTLLVASSGFMVAAVLAHNTAGFESWRDGLATTYLWNFALTGALYALLAVLLVGHGVARLISTQPFRAMDLLDDALWGLLRVLAVLLVVGPYLGGVWYFLGWSAVVARLQWAAIPCLVLLAWVAYRRMAARNRRVSSTTSVDEDGRS